MKELEKMLHEFENLIGSEDERDIRRKEEIAKWLEANNSGETQQKLSEMAHRQMDVVEKNLKEIEQEVMRDQMGNTIYKLIPWSYIAREYFHKTPGWLLQRVNGSAVRGKVYTLNEEQRRILSLALEDICNKIDSYRQTLI